MDSLASLARTVSAVADRLTAGNGDLPSPIELLARMEAAGLITAAMRRAGTTYHQLAQDPRRWERHDPYRGLFDALGGWDSPAAVAALAMLDLGWPLEEFARSRWRGWKMSRDQAIGLFVAALTTLAALLPAMDPDSESDADRELDLDEV